MTDTLDPKLLDKRIVARNVKKGLVGEKDYERHIRALPDLAEAAAPVEATVESMQTAGLQGEAPTEED
jgi:hypothetical protein